MAERSLYCNILYGYDKKMDVEIERLNKIACNMTTIPHIFKNYIFLSKLLATQALSVYGNLINGSRPTGLQMSMNLFDSSGRLGKTLKLDTHTSTSPR